MGHEEKSVTDLAILEFAKTARILQRQLKIMRPMLSNQQNMLVCEIIEKVEAEFREYKL